MQTELPLTSDTDDAPFEITVLIEAGVCVGVLMNGERIRANVHDYDVQYPIGLNEIAQDADGRDYTPMVVQ